MLNCLLLSNALLTPMKVGVIHELLAEDLKAAACSMETPFRVRTGRPCLISGQVTPRYTSPHHVIDKNC